MLKPPRSRDETRRLETLHALHLLDAPPQERFDRITRTAIRLFDVPTALVSLIDAERRTTISHAGLDVPETDRDLSFCAHAAECEGVMVVEDAASHLQFFDNPLVTGKRRIRFYAGAPIRARNGARLGALCIMGSEPRQMNAEEREALADLAAVVEDEIDAATAAVVDDLTGLVNRRGLALLGAHAMLRAHRCGEAVTALFIDVDDMKEINDRFGHSAGDTALGTVAETLCSTVRGADVAARIGGDEFAVLLPDTEATEAGAVVARILERIAATHAASGAAFPLEVSVGRATAVAPEASYRVDELLALADAAMYEAKGRRKTGRSRAPDE